MKTLLVINKKEGRENFNSHSIELACQYFNFELEIFDSKEVLDYKTFEVIFIDQHSFNHTGIEKAIELAKKLPHKKIFLLF